MGLVIAYRRLDVLARESTSCIDGRRRVAMHESNSVGRVGKDMLIENVKYPWQSWDWTKNTSAMQKLPSPLHQAPRLRRMNQYTKYSCPSTRKLLMGRQT